MHPAIDSDRTEPDAPGSLRELLRVAIPLVISTGSLSLMHVTDRVMLTWYSTDALAASTPGGMLHFTLYGLPFGIATYVNTFVAQYHGAGRPGRVAAVIWQGLWMSAIAGILLAVTVPWTRHLTSLFGHTPEVTRLESEYFTILAFGSLPGLVSAILSAFYGGRGRTTSIACVNMAMALANAGINYLLIFGVGPFPELGIEGAAWGTVLSQIIGCVMYAGWMWIDPESRAYPFREEMKVDRELSGRLIRYGLPNGLQFLADIGAFLLFLVFIGRLGRDEQAATNLAFNLNSLAFIPLFGLGTAVSILVGRRVGEGRPALAERTTWLGFGLASIYTAIWAVIYLAAPDAILAPFGRGSDPAEFAVLSDMVKVLLYFVVLYMFFDAMAVIFGSAIRGAGDTHFSMVFNTLVLWLVMVLPVYVIYMVGGSMHACWIALCVQLVVLGSGFVWRFLGRKWLDMRVIEGGMVPIATPLEEPAALLMVGAAEVQNVQTVLLDE
jgi:MATE family multidrug resistance protein